MTAREALARVVYEDVAMNGLGFTSDNVFASNSVTNPENFSNFIVIMDDGTQKRDRKSVV